MADTRTTVELLLKARDDATGAIDHVSESLNRMHEHMMRIRDIALGNIIGDMAISGIDRLTSGIADFGKGLVTANADAESMHQTLQALYGTKTEADQAFNWMTKFALQAPFTRASIIEAGVAITSFGGDITKVLPALGNVAAVMGTTMPIAARAFNDAIAGRFRMMETDLHISKEALVQFGMEMNKSGHITNIQSFVTAFEKLAQTRFGSGMSLQMQTFNGQVSNLVDQFQNLQRTMGAGIFEAVKGQLFGLITFLNTHQNQVNKFAAVVGASLAGAAKAFFAFGQLAIGAIVPAVNIISKAWSVMSTATSTVFGFVGTVIGAFASWFVGTALPPIETAIGAFAGWWADNGKNIEQSLINIWGKIKDFGNLLVKGLRDVWNYASADVKFWWDSLQMLFTLGQDAIKGNWGKFGTDFVSGVKKLAGDAVQVFASMITGFVDLVTRLAYSVMEAMVPVANNLMGPMTWVAQHFRDAFKEIGGLFGTFAGMAAMAGAALAGPFIIGVNTIINGIKKLNSELPGFMQRGWIKKLHDVGMPDPGQTGAAAKKAVTGWFDKNAPGLDKGQTYTPSQTVAQAQAGMEADRKKFLGPFDAFVAMEANKIQNMFDPSAAHTSKAKKDAHTLGVEIVRNLFSGFGGMTGGLTLADILKKLGIPLNAGGMNFGPLPGQGGLPVAGFGDAGAAGGVGGSGAGGLGSQHAVTGRVPLGALGATFGQTLATLVGNGTDPATRAAQKTAEGVQTQLSQGAKGLTLAERQANAVDAVHQVLVEVRDAIKSMGLPHPTPGSPLVHHAVGRPVF